MNSQSNGTVLGIAPLTRTLPVIGAGLVALFVLMRPETSAGLSFPERVLFWSAHVGVGLAGIVLASYLLGPLTFSRVPLPIALLGTGVVSSAIVAPIYLGMDQILSGPALAEPDDWLDEFATRGIGQALVAEFIEFTPMFLAAWALVNLPLLLGRTRPGPNKPPPGDDDVTPAPPKSPGPPEAGSREAFIALLPKALGEDVVAVSADLHYLHVHTTAGRCMILCTLKQAATALGEAGMQVHRSHWIARDHVTRLVPNGSGIACVMSNDLRIPVSRRRQREVRAWFGRDARLAAN